MERRIPHPESPTEVRQAFQELDVGLATAETDLTALDTRITTLETDFGKAKIDSGATADYLGAAHDDGVLRTGTGITFTDGGNFVTLTINDGEIDHGSLAGLGDDDHTDYHTDGRAATWLAANHETTYNHAHYDTAYGWGNHATPEYRKYDAVTLTNGNAGAIVVGQPVYTSDVNEVDLAKADAATTIEVLGLVQPTSIASAASGLIATDGIVTATTGQWDAVTGDSGGLTHGEVYYLSAATAGELTKTAPTTAGQYVVRIGKAISTREMRISISQPILL